MSYEKLIKDVPNFPKEGIIFKDITPIFENKEAFKSLMDDLSVFAQEHFEFDKLALVESRGFIFGSPLSDRIDKPFCLVRKPGKLPRKTYSKEYELEYGSDCLEVHCDSIKKGERVLIIDDLLATGGTAKAAEDLIEKAGGVCAGTLCLIELSFLKGREKLQQKFKALITY